MEFFKKLFKRKSADEKYDEALAKFDKDYDENVKNASTFQDLIDGAEKALYKNYDNIMKAKKHISDAKKAEIAEEIKQSEEKRKKEQIKSKKFDDGFDKWKSLMNKGEKLEKSGKLYEAQKIFNKASNQWCKMYCEYEEISANDIFNEKKKITVKEHADQISRVNIIRNKLMRDKIKELEIEAKKEEKINPNNAIKLYMKLNELKPGLKKYNKRIEILERKLKKEK